jgi:3D (Asp-Asp-Asp) domain-containing protein
MHHGKIIAALLASYQLANAAIVTAYCPCRHCCGQWSIGSKYQRTASGTIPKEGRTAAATRDRKLGSRITLFGRTYIVEDRLHSKYKKGRIEIFMNSHQRAKEFGRKVIP